MPLGGGSSDIRIKNPFAVSAHGLPQKIEFVISCQPRNISKWASGMGALLLSPVPAKPGRSRAQEGLLILRRLCGQCTCEMPMAVFSQLTGAPRHPNQPPRIADRCPVAIVYLLAHR